MRVLLTGAGGFIGSHVSRALLKQGAEVAAVLRHGDATARIADLAADLLILEANLNSTEPTHLVAKPEPDVSIHLAWYVEPDRYLTDVSENLASLSAGVRLLSALDRAGCARAVLAGTCLETGTLINGEPRPAGTIYAAAKAALHEVAMQLSNTGVACAHVFYLYGPGENEQRVVPAVIRACLEGRMIDVSSGEQQRDLLHVEDVAAGIVSLAMSDVRGGVDICSGTSTALRKVFELIGTATGRPELIGIGNRANVPGEPFRIAGNSSTLSGTGWRPRRSLEDGIADTVDWWRARLQHARNEI
jgi:nucleoside-diphosphate-sugar epimerase